MGERGDVTAQAFREAAADAVNAYGDTNSYITKVAELLLVAAEQREQVDAERLVVDVITEKQRVQIATLTAEQRADAARWPGANKEAPQQIETLTAERDTARARIAAICEWANGLIPGDATHILIARVYSDLLSILDQPTPKEILDAPTRPA